jgi:hypothetical protein
MRLLSIITIILYLCVSCGGGNSNSTAGQKETTSGSINDCFTEDVAGNIRTFFTTLKHKKTMKGSANYHLGDEHESNGTGEVIVTHISDSNWIMQATLCDSMGNCRPHESNFEIKNGCLFINNIVSKVYLSRETDLEALVTRKTSDGKVRKDFNDFSTESSVSIRTSSVVDGFYSDSIEFQEY